MSEPAVDLAGLFQAAPNPYLVLDRKLHIATANAAYLASTGRELSDIVGRWAWDAFPTDPETLATSVASFEKVIATGQADTMSLRFDIPSTTGQGGFEERHWSLVHSPVFDRDGQVSHVIQHALDVTEKVRAEAELRETETRYRQIVEGAEDFAIVSLDDHGVITGWNSGAEHVVGFRRDEAIGQSGAIVFTPEDRAAGAPDREMNRASSDDRAVDERWHQRKDGSRFWGSGLTMRQEGPGGGYLKMFRDRTAEHEAESAARVSQERYRTLFENIDAGFCIAEVIFDDEGRAVDYRLVEVNPAFERQSGLKDAVGRRAREMLPDHEQHWFEIYGRIVLTGEPARFENGSAALGRWFDVQALRIGAPEERRVAILFTDVSERRRAEQRLRELNETLEQQVGERTAELRRFRDIVDATASPICAFDTELRLVAFNKAHSDEFRRVQGFNCKLGDVFPDLFIADQQPAMRALMNRALTGERFTVTEAFGRPEYGVPMWEISYTPLCDESGQVIGAFHLASDVSERLRAQAELEIAQEALRHSQKMDAMGQLTGGVAHDFNNLLTPIIGSLDMLVRRGVGSERERRLIDGGLQSAERAKTLVQRLLAFARRQPLQPVAVDVPRLVDGMVDLISSTIGPTIELRVDLAANLPPARADPNQLEMALLNLAVNARDAMPDGGVLTLSACRESGRGPHRSLKLGHYVRLSVTDTGVGMDQATRERAIEPFYSTKGVGKGTGLGLSMVHGLAAQLGGGLNIESAVGQGTTVELWLPASAGVVEDVRTVDPTGPDSVGRGLALLVDDEELVRQSTADMLTDLGFEVVEAGSAENALQLLNAGLAPDLVVTDHLMPGLSGADLACEIRATRPATPILIVSGFAEVEGVAADLPRLTKPFRIVDLAASIISLMETGER